MIEAFFIIRFQRKLRALRARVIPLAEKIDLYSALAEVEVLRAAHFLYSFDYLIQMVGSGPANQWNNISFVFLKAITLAKRCVYIQTPYFLPSDALLKALQSAALAGVEVHLMIPRKPDSLLLRLATGSYIKECLMSGIKIYFYEPTVLHSKVVIVDDEFVTTGSTNFDFRFSVEP